jgi:signal transduction histidine kinase
LVTLPRSADSLPGQTRRGRWLLLTVPVVVALAVAVQWPIAGREPAFALANVLVTATFYVTGLLLFEEAGQGSSAFALVMFAVFYAVGWLNEWELGPFPFLAEVLGPLALAFGAWGLLRHPDPLERWHERALVVAMFAWLSGGQALLAPISLPQWHHFGAGVWWPAVLPSQALAETGHDVYEAGAALLAAAFVVVLLARLAGRGGIDRRLTGPVALASAVGGVAVGAEAVGEFLALPLRQMDDVFTASGLVLLLIPAAFLATVVRRRMARAAVADLVLRVASPGLGENVREALREALTDPTLEVLYWMPDDQAFVNGCGYRVERPAESPDRLTVEVRMHDGELLAIVLADASLRRDRGLLEAATMACGLALENARLQAAMRAQLEQVRASRARIVEAGLAARRRVERDLHDGAQQRLLALATKLAVARTTAPDTPTVVAIDDARRELRLALEDLRSLAHGIYPPVLSQSGLGPALEEVAERLPLAIKVDVPVRRFEPAIETTAYLVACEALANTVKHAAAERATVRALLAPTALHVEIADDGRGGAAPVPDGGLAGLADRVRALGGELTVTSPPGAGTRVIARLPCA